VVLFKEANVLGDWWWMSPLAFILGFCEDYCATSWMRAVSDFRPYRAGMWSVYHAVCAQICYLAWSKECYPALVAFMVGLFWGTVFGVRKKRK